jgi:hypothetical protein
MPEQVQTQVQTRAQALNAARPGMTRLEDIRKE